MDHLPDSHGQAAPQSASCVTPYPGCETVDHCRRNGCVPITTTRPPAVLQPPMATNTADFASGVKAAADWVARRQAQFVEAHGKVDPSTGTMEFGSGAQAEAKIEYVGELTEIEEGIRGLAAAPQPTVDAAPAAPEPCRPDLLERLSYHQLERDDLTIDECLSYLNGRGWTEVHGRTTREMVMQILALLAAAPAAAERQGALDAISIGQAAWELVFLAEKHGMCVRISRQSLQPLAMGHACHDVEVWPARQSARSGGEA